VYEGEVKPEYKTEPPVSDAPVPDGKAVEVTVSEPEKAEGLILRLKFQSLMISHRVIALSFLTKMMRSQLLVIMKLRLTRLKILRMRFTFLRMLTLNLRSCIR